jgi:hypothetical protein
MIGYIKGGLANQMFQYAFFQTVCKLNNYELFLDLSWFDNSEVEQWNIDSKKIKTCCFQINVFESNHNIFNMHDTTYLFHKRYPGYKNFILRKIYNQIEKLKPYHKKVFISQKSKLYDEKLLKIKSNSHVTGFFQHHQYLDLNRNAILKCFQLKKESQNKNFLDLKNRFVNCKSISVHVRRGDYVGLNHACSENYFNSAIQYIMSKVKNAEFFIFSDDIDWCKTHLSFQSAPNFIDDKYDLEDYHELMLMKYCKHNVISNSSFSWWGAWLNENPNKIVIYPDKIKETLNKDLCVESWIELKN